MFRWVGEATTFFKKHADELKALKAQGLVVGVFVNMDPRQRLKATRSEGQVRREGLDRSRIKAEVDIRRLWRNLRPLLLGANGLSRQANARYRGKTDGQRYGHPSEGRRSERSARFGPNRTFAEHFAQLLKAGDGAN